MIEGDHDVHTVTTDDKVISDAGYRDDEKSTEGPSHQVKTVDDSKLGNLDHVNKSEPSGSLKAIGASKTKSEKKSKKLKKRTKEVEHTARMIRSMTAKLTTQELANQSMPKEQIEVTEPSQDGVTPINEIRQAHDIEEFDEGNENIKSAVEDVDKNHTEGDARHYYEVIPDTTRIKESISEVIDKSNAIEKNNTDDKIVKPKKLVDSESMYKHAIAKAVAETKTEES